MISLLSVEPAKKNNITKLELKKCSKKIPRVKIKKKLSGNFLKHFFFVINFFIKIVNK